MKLHHQGKLFPETLFKALPTLRTAKFPKICDPLGIGRRIQFTQDPVEFCFDGLLYGTAEAFVSLELLRQSVKRSIGDNNFTLNFPGASLAWGEAVGLAATHLAPSLDTNWKEVSGCWVYPLTAVNIHSKEEVVSVTEQIMSSISHLHHDQRLDKELILTIGRVTYELLLNVYEHAYINSKMGDAYLCATVTPAKSFRVEDNASLSEEEDVWFTQQQTGWILEMAVGDAGVGIPSTLGQWALDSQLIGQLELSKIGRDARLRSKIHQELCDLAFNHDSTRKKLNDFENSIQNLVWRGLNRCLKHSDSLGGCLLLASGYGRAGYVSTRQGLNKISAKKFGVVPLPGTIGVVRVPYGIHAKSLGKIQTERQKIPSYVRRSSVVAKNRQIADLDKNSFEITPMPFRHFSRFVNIYDVIKSVDSKVKIFLFMDFEKTLIPEFQAYTTNWTKLETGSPQLLSILNLDKGRFDWFFVGTLPIPKDGNVFNEVQEFGSAIVLGQSEAVLQTARDLATFYPNFIQYDEKTHRLELTAFNLKLDESQYSEYLNAAVRLLISSDTSSQFLYESDETRVFLLPTGRLVERFISVRQLLLSNPVLVKACTHRLMALLQEFGDPEFVCLLADCQASLSVAGILLRDVNHKPGLASIQNLNAQDASAQFKSFVLFVDAAYRGEMTRAAVEKLQGNSRWSRTVIACFDLRKISSDIFNEGYSIKSILQYPFDAKEIKTANERDVLVIDSVTHSPVRENKFSFSKVFTTKFLSTNLHLFRLGYHFIGGRIHTISLDTDRLIQDQRSFLEQELTKKIGGFRDYSKGKRDLVVFCRSDSSVYQLHRGLAQSLERACPWIKNVFLSHLDVERINQKSVFPLASKEIINDLVYSGTQFSLFEQPALGDYIAVYLDDAALTGSSLQDFLFKVMNLQSENQPQSVHAIVLVNRLSPREERFFSLIPRLKIDEFEVAFSFDDLIKLPVRVAQREELGGLRAKLHSILRRSRNFDSRLTEYIETISKKIDSFVEKSYISDELQFPFYARNVKARSVSFDVIKLRALLSLHEQNEGVSYQLLETLGSIYNGNQYEALSIFSLEPQLLENKILESEWWVFLEHLALNCIDNGLPEQKSDALFVLSHKPNRLIKNAERILGKLYNHEELITLFVALLLACREHEDYSSIENIVKGGGVIHHENIDWVRSIIAVSFSSDLHRQITNDSEADSAIKRLIACSWPHLGLDDWHAFTYHMQKKSTVLNSDIKKLAQKCIQYAQSFFLPGLAALAFISEKALKVKESAQLYDAQVKAITQIFSLKEGLKESNLDMVRNAWNLLQTVTIKGVSPLRVLGPLEQIGDSEAVIGTMIQLFFSDPFRLVTQFKGQINLDLEINFDDKFEVRAVVAKSPKQIVRTFINTLLLNQKKYAAGSVKFDMIYDENTNTLELHFSNDYHESGDHPIGYGIPLLKSLAKAGGFIFEHSHNGKYESTVRFDALLIEPDMQRLFYESPNC